MEQSKVPLVMVVDDEPPLVDLVCDCLEDAGIAAMSCTHSEEAYASIQEHRPALVILDVQMPEVDGLKVFRQMRADPAMRETPVIFFTANINKLRRWIPDYQSLGAELLPKPFELDRLLDLVQQAMLRPRTDPTT
jgi:CheY-like chemotaxis protein